MPTSRSVCLAALSLFLALMAPALLPAAPFLVRDLNPGTGTLNAEVQLFGATGRDGVFYFSAPDPTHGFELWRSDGTGAGTERLTDICAGRCSSFPYNIEIIGDTVYFDADDGFSGIELWRSDGTPGSERRVRDLCAGPCASTPATLLELSGALLFVARSGDDWRLWRTTGSRRSTVPLATVCPGAGDRDCTSNLQRVGDVALFTAGDKLWRSDGTAAGTVALDVPGLPVVVGGLLSAGPFAFLFTGDALWRTDGTAAGTVRLKAVSDFLPGSGGGFLWQRVAIWKGRLYAVLGTSQVVLIRSDGTAAGTILLENVPAASGINDLIPTAGSLFLIGTESSTPNKLFRIEGAPETIEKVLDLGNTPDFLIDAIALGDRLIFRVGRRASQAVEIWVTDGTAAGTRLLDAGLPNEAAWSMASDGTRAYYLRGGGDQSTDLWRTDGTPAGTFEVRDFGTGPAAGGPLGQSELGGGLVFSAQTSDLQAPLFRSDGTARGTQLLSTKASWARQLTRVGDRVFFSSQTSGVLAGGVPYFAPNGLWSTDGTPAGTVEVSARMLSFQPLAALQGDLFFAGGFDAGTPFSGPDIELWRSDGHGVSRVRDINPWQIDTGFHNICAAASSLPGSAVVLGNILLFAADDGVAGRELWRSNGTSAGTRLVRDIDPRRLPVPPAAECDNRASTGVSSSPAELVRLGNGVVFTAEDGDAGREIWWTDGTAAGTRRILDLRPGPDSSEPHGLTLFHNAVWFFASTEGAGEELWRTDGTAAGTVLVRDLTTAALPSWARSPVVAGERLFFVVFNEQTGAELWTSRGDSASTGLVIDLRPGAPSSSPQFLTDAGRGLLVFAADDGVTGLEPWRSDGTAAGTFRLGDIHPGRDASSPGPFTRAGNRIFTGADDGVHGRELWTIPLADLLRRP